LFGTPEVQLPEVLQSLELLLVQVPEAAKAKDEIRTIVRERTPAKMVKPENF
jgi:hypothetical protein